MPPPAAPSDGESGSAATNRIRRRIAGAAGIMMSGILLSRILGFVRDRVIAHQFGQGRETDIYNAAFTIPDLLFFLIAGGALSSAFIPVFTEYVSTNREKEAWRIFSVVCAVMAVVITVFIIICEIFAPTLVIWTNPGYDAAKAAAAVPLTRILLPAQLCFFLGGLMMGTLQAKHIFAGPAFGPVIYNLGIIAGGILLTHRLGVAGLCWGALGGAIVGNLGLQWYLVRKAGGVFTRRNLWKHWRHPGVIQVWKLMLPVILGLALPQISTIINKFFASSLGDGPQSALMNANRLMQVPIALFAQGPAIAIFPTLSAQAANKQIDAMRSTINYGIRSILFLTVPASFVMAVLALPIVQVILQTGRFHEAQARMAATALIWYSVGIFAWSAHAVIARGFYALQDSLTPVVVGTIVTVVFIALNRLFAHLMGYGGLAFATSVAAAIHMTSMLYLLRRRLKGIEGGKLLISTTKIVFASVLAAGLCKVLRDLMQSHLGRLGHASSGKALLTVVVCLAASGGFYVAVAMALRMEEVAVLQRFINRGRRGEGAKG
jgi:putative peptidoglycan lipid II flippase